MTPVVVYRIGMDPNACYSYSGKMIKISLDEHWVNEYGNHVWFSKGYDPNGKIDKTRWWKWETGQQASEGENMSDEKQRNTVTDSELRRWRSETLWLREKMEDIALIDEAPGGLAIAKAIAYSALNKSIEISGSKPRERTVNSLVLTLRTVMTPEMAERAVELIQELIETKERK